MNTIESCLCGLTAAAIAWVIFAGGTRWETVCLRQSLEWMRDERKRAFDLLGADDYPDGDLCDWIRQRGDLCGWVRHGQNNEVREEEGLPPIEDEPKAKAHLLEALRNLHADVVSLVECIEECEEDGGQSYDTVTTRRLLGKAFATIAKAEGKEGNQ